MIAVCRGVMSDQLESDAAVPGNTAASWVDRMIRIAAMIATWKISRTEVYASNGRDIRPPRTVSGNGEAEPA
jgi:hypothetical protein